MKLIKVYRVMFLACCVTIAASIAGGQDLGSSNGLFGASKSTSTKKPVKKAPAKTAEPRKKPVSKAKPSAPPKTEAKSIRKPAKTEEKSAKSTISKKAEPTTARNRDTAVKPKTENPLPAAGSTRPRDVSVPVGKAADELFEQLIDQGNRARDDREYTEAEIAYNKAASVKPKDARAVFGLANLFSDQLRWEDAEDSYREALKIDPRDAAAYIALSFVLTQPIVAPNLSDRYEEAERLAKKSIELAPDNALAFDQLGVAMELRGLIGSATENAYRKAIRLDPSFAPAYAHLGRLLRRMGRNADSMAAYQDAMRYLSDVPTTILVADVMQSELRFAESEKILRSALETDPKNPAGLLLLGRALTALQNYKEAESVLRRCAAVMPNAFVPNSLLGTLFERQGKPELAENALLQAQRYVSPREKRSLSMQFESVGDAYMKTGRFDSAERAYRLAQALDTERESLAGKINKARRR